MIKEMNEPMDKWIKINQKLLVKNTVTILRFLQQNLASTHYYTYKTVAEISFISVRPKKFLRKKKPKYNKKKEKHCRSKKISSK